MDHTIAYRWTYQHPIHLTKLRFKWTHCERRRETFSLYMYLINRARDYMIVIEYSRAMVSFSILQRHCK